MDIKTIKRLFAKDPSDEIKSRMATHIDEFVKVSLEIGKGKYPNMSGDYLLGGMFSSHPAIHIGYFDKIEDGIIFVKDQDGKFLRKDEAVLTLDGKFIPRGSKSITSLGAATVKSALFQYFILGSKEKIEKWADDKYLSIGQLVVPIKLEYLRPNINCNDVQRFMFDRWATWQSTNQIEDDAVTPEVIRTFLAYCQDDFKRSDWPPQVTGYILVGDRTSEFDANTVPKDSVFLPGVHISNGFDTTSSTYAIMRERGEVPAAYLNNIEESFLLDRTRLRYGVVEYDFAPFMKVAFRTSQLFTRTTNSQTRNNRGELLQYSTKVTDYKVSFRMTEDEKRFYNYHETLIKPQLSAYRKKCDLKRAEMRREGHTSGIISVAISHIERPKIADTNLPIMLGVEIELEMKSQYSGAAMSNVIADIANSKFGDHAIMKSDSSIGSNGIEIVTIPATLAVHKQMFEDYFFSTTNAFQTKFKSSERCGIHVHISKNSFTTLTLGKFMTFINSPKNASFMNTMAGRPPNEYCKKQPLKGHVNGSDASVTIAKLACEGGSFRRGLSFRDLGHHNPSRRVAVNLDNANTVEVRIFKSSNDRANVMRKIEFCDALVRFCRDTSTQQLSAENFVDFILDKGNRKVYPSILRWLASKNYVEHEIRKVAGKSKLQHVYSKNKLKKETK